MQEPPDVQDRAALLIPGVRAVRVEDPGGKWKRGTKMISAAVVGASGYGGGEVLRLLLHHPQVDLRVAISETYAGKPLAAALPGLAGRSALRYETYGDGTAVKQCDVVFLAQDNGRAMETAPQLLAAGCKVVDLSADFRFRDVAVYAKWYNKAHASPQWNGRAAYGLPELYAEAIRNAPLVGNPGCYPTATILALAPLCARRAVDPATIIVDAKSGVSGAGRSKFCLEYHFAEINESVSAYKVGGSHRHTPEIEQALGQLADAPIAVTFTPHLIPMTRGILATCYGTLREPGNLDDLYALYEDFYAAAPFVEVTRDTMPATKHTLGSNRCHIGIALHKETNRVIVLSAIDNLIKGTAGQAVQNMNLMFGFPETEGLVDAGGLWP
jgi:N-acetyl-gamma-glutamyl-phosphate reductase